MAPRCAAGTIMPFCRIRPTTSTSVTPSLAISSITGRASAVRSSRRSAITPDEQSAWTSAQTSNTAEAYRAFLAQYPASLNATAAQWLLAMVEARQISAELRAGIPEIRK